MTGDRTLLVGYDLCDDFTQISCINLKSGIIEPIGLSKEKENSSIPTVMAVKEDSKEWLFGEDAVQCGLAGEGNVITNLVSRTIDKQPFVLYDVAFSPESLWEKYFKKTLSLLKRYYPNDSIGQLVITVEHQNKDLVQVLYKALESLGINRDRVVIQNHTLSYIYFALAQKKEIWLNDVALFELNEKGFTYSQLIIDKKMTPMIISVAQKDLSDTLNYADLLGQTEKENLGYIFENLAKSVLHKQVISTIFITGRGFDGDWCDAAIKQLCIGRRVFKGQNLFTQGACYAAREIAGNGTLDQFLYLSEDRIKCNVILNVYCDAKIQEAVLVKAGTPWYEVSGNIDVILDSENEVEILVQDILSKEVRKHLLALDGMEPRPNRTTRLSIHAECSDEHTMVFTVKDKGFGMLFPSSDRIWEKRITLY